MNVEIKNISDSKTDLGRYFYAEMVAGKHSATVGLTPNSIHVYVHNASARVWRGGGKFFDTVEKALANYKSEAVKAMILSAVELAKSKGAA